MRSGEKRPPFGVGECLRLTFRIFLDRWPFFVAFGVCVSLSIFLVTTLMTLLLVPPLETLTHGDEVVSSPASFAVFGLLLTPITLAVVNVEFAFYAMAAYDTRAGYRIVLRDYWRASWKNLIPMLAMMVAVGLLVALGLMLFILPGLLLAAVYLVTIPSVFVDRAGFGAMGRSRWLTRHYRWPILGLILSLWLFMVVLQLPVYAALYLSGPSWIVNFLGAAWQGVQMPLFGILTAAAHMRLVEIKERQPVPAA